MADVFHLKSLWENSLHIRFYDYLPPSFQLRNHNRVKAPTAERAASLLDAAIAARRHSDFITYLSHSSIMFFTLHIQPPRTESSTTGKGCIQIFSHQGGLFLLNFMFLLELLSIANP